MNRPEAWKYMHDLRQTLAPVPPGLNASDIAGRGEIRNVVRELRLEDPRYKEAIEVFKRAGQIHRDNLKIRDSEGNPTNESFSKNAFDYIANLVEIPQMVRLFNRGDGTFIKIFTPESPDYHDSSYIEPEFNQRDKIVVVETWNAHWNSDDDWDPQLLESYSLVKGHSETNNNIPSRRGVFTGSVPPIYTGVREDDPEAQVNASHIAAFMYLEIGKYLMHELSPGVPMIINHQSEPPQAGN